MTLLTAVRGSTVRTMNKLRPIVLSGGSGTGKSTLLNRAMKEHPGVFAFSVSHTTREPRAGEIDGVHYHFVRKFEMEEMIDDHKFIEYAKFGSNLYGTSKQAVKDISESGRICILDIELTGVRSLRKLGVEANYILVRAPSLEELERRLRLRGTETEDSLKLRLQHAFEDDIAASQEPDLFDTTIINENVDEAYSTFLHAIQPELAAFKA